MPGERHHGVPVPESLERLDEDDEGLLLDIDDSKTATDPAVGRFAGVDQQRDRESRRAGRSAV
jgi:hypothetical protein